MRISHFQEMDIRIAILDQLEVVPSLTSQRTTATASSQQHGIMIAVAVTRAVRPARVVSVLRSMSRHLGTQMVVRRACRLVTTTTVVRGTTT